MCFTADLLFVRSEACRSSVSANSDVQILIDRSCTCAVPVFTARCYAQHGRFLLLALY